MARTSKTMLNESGENGHLCLIPDLRGRRCFQFSHCWDDVFCGLVIWPLLHWRMFPLCPLSRNFFIISGCWILSKVFFASTEIIIWFLFFSLLMWFITLIDLHMLKSSCLSGINPTWSGYMMKSSCLAKLLATGWAWPACTTGAGSWEAVHVVGIRCWVHQCKMRSW